MSNLESDNNVELQQNNIFLTQEEELFDENGCSGTNLGSVNIESLKAIKNENFEKSTSIENFAFMTKGDYFSADVNSMKEDTKSLCTNTNLNDHTSSTEENSSDDIAIRCENDIKIPHVCSEPIFTTQLQQSEHQQKIKTYQNAKQSAIWQIESSDNKNIITKYPTHAFLKTSDTVTCLPRRVSFPKSDSELVTGYLEPADPWKHVSLVKSNSELTELYILSCTKHKTQPLKTVLQHLKVLELNKELRQPLLSLSGNTLNAGDCEALEEIFKRVQYKSIDLSGCDLDEISASALFEMIEYYEATNELNISSNSKGMTHRGWISCSYMLSHSQALHSLNAQANPLSKSSAENLGHALSLSNLHTLKLEHCGLKGTPLTGLCFKLRNNKTLRELWLAYNDLDCYDADTIGELLKVNHFLELVDISNNIIKNEGLEHIVKALIIQSHELQRRSMLHRSSAIDSDEIVYPGEISNTALYSESDNKHTLIGKMDQTISDASVLNLTNNNLNVSNIQKSEENQCTASDNCNITDDFKRLLGKNSHQSNGQSMLDKLLSMESVNSSSRDVNTGRPIEDETKNSGSPSNTFYDVVASAGDNIETLTTERDVNKITNTHLLGRTEALECNVDIHFDKNQLKKNKSDKKYEGSKLRFTDDCDDAYSTDSAFESASEGDISRHVPDEYNIYSNSHEFLEVDDAVNDLSTEKHKLTPDTTENILDTDKIRKITIGPCVNQDETKSNVVLIPKVTLDEGSIVDRYRENITTLAPTPPPPSTSPGKTTLGIHRSESNCSLLNHAVRHRSQSSDSLCSDTSLDGSLSSELNFSTSGQLNEKITKNDTLTRQTRHSEISNETSYRSPGGLKALVVWNNQLTKESAFSISNLLIETSSLELFNIGKNCLSNDFIFNIKGSLKNNTTVTTLGLQSAHISEKGIEDLSSVLSFGGNSTLQRIDIRDNKLEVHSLTAIAEALKSNNCVTQIDLDDVPKRLSVGSEEHLDYKRVVEMIRSMCARNERANSNFNPEKFTNNKTDNVKSKSGYFLGSRKISLTMATRPLIDSQTNFIIGNSNITNKLDIKRRQGTRLRSPVPSPPTISPSSSPSRSRFQVFRVHEVSPLSSPSAGAQPILPISSNTNDVGCENIIKASFFSHSLHNQQPFHMNIAPTSCNLPTSSSLPSMATITSSTQSIKRLAIPVRSRFHVSKIYEDPLVPLAKRSLPPITPPIRPPPTPIAKELPEAIVIEPQNVPDVLVHDISKHNNRYDALNKNSNTLAIRNIGDTNSMPANCTSTFSNLISPLSSSSTTGVPPFFSKNNTPASTLSANTFNSEPSIMENETTLTQMTCENVFFNEKDSGTHHTNEDQSELLNVNAVENTSTKTTQQKSRKVSWIEKPAAVDKLLTLFQNPSTLFQRSCSPEPKLPLSALTAIQEPSTSKLSCTATLGEHNSGEESNNKCSKPELSEITGAMTTNDMNTGNVDQSRSFLNVATKQFRDLGKQVFSFGQEMDLSNSDADNIENSTTNNEKSKSINKSSKNVQEK